MNFQAHRAFTEVRGSCRRPTGLWVGLGVLLLACGSYGQINLLSDNRYVEVAGNVSLQTPASAGYTRSASPNSPFGAFAPNLTDAASVQGWVPGYPPPNIFGTVSTDSQANQSSLFGPGEIAVTLDVHWQGGYTSGIQQGYAGYSGHARSHFEITFGVDLPSSFSLSAVPGTFSVFDSDGFYPRYIAPFSGTLSSAGLGTLNLLDFQGYHPLTGTLLPGEVYTLVLDASIGGGNDPLGQLIQANDNFSFTVTTIPEPGVGSLLCLALGLASLRARSGRNRA